MWSDAFQPLSRLEMRSNHVADVAFRDGKLYFALHIPDDNVLCDDCAVEVATVGQKPQEETQVLESAEVGKIYILSGERAFLSHTQGRYWEEM